MNEQIKQFGGKVAFVTGAGSGIGRAAALAFAREGADVVVADNVEQANHETARMIDELGARALAVTCDIARGESVKAALDRTVEVYGRLDVAFNNAGVEQPKKPAADVGEAEWDHIVGTDLRGTFLCMKYEIPLMLKQGGGAIVNTSSGAGVKGFKDQAAYCAAKWGIVGLTKAAALDYAARKIRVNVVAPGETDTPMTERMSKITAGGLQSIIEEEPIGRLGTPGEIANAVLWLCSDAAAFVTGAVLVADGGQTT